LESALAPELLALALGEQANLPSARELSELLAEAELALLVHQPDISDRLIAVGWYLHAVASSRYALKTYGIERQRAAFKVSGHIFDLLLQTRDLQMLERLKYCFAAQIAYLRGTLDPNASALYRREFAGRLGDLKLVSGHQEVALACGVAFLGFDVASIFERTDLLRTEAESLQGAWAVDSVLSTPLASALGVALGVRELMSFLVYGNSGALERARGRLRMSVLSENADEDHLSRWVAAHLLNLADDLGNASIWTVLPPDVPPSVRKAFAMGRPRVLTLWPPQLNLFGSHEQEGGNPLSSQVKRLFLSTPTSGGKTLMGQLLVAAHLATEQTSVCYVAPTRSLCSEIRKSLQARMRFLGKEIAAGLPEGDWLAGVLTIDNVPEVEVMTPERLSYLVRADSQRLLDQFGMFIFDEVHLIGEPERGWALEEDLTYLHHATLEKPHRIVLMSAAIGNRNHFVEWMSEGVGDVFYRHSDWRGPRRLHAIWTTCADWDNGVEEPSRSRAFPRRVRYPLYGELHARVSHSGEVPPLTTSEPVGQLVFKLGKDGGRERDSRLSTPFYRTLIHLILHLAESGPVLVIESTRRSTVRTAKAISESRSPVEDPAVLALVDAAEARFGTEHPLCSVLRRGVAYHHGSLPGDIRVSIEEAMSEGHLRILVATTTLTEGVNLPVQSVVVASQGFRTADGEVEYITGSKLINAVGRAGRATRETEGIVVLARSAAWNPADFNRLSPGDSGTTVSSQLASIRALDALAAFEELQRATQDAVLRTATGVVSDFLSFVWFVAAEWESCGELATQDSIQEVLQHSLAWVQLNPDDRQRWLAAAGLALLRYYTTPPQVRRRWAVARTTIASSNEMESIAQELAASLQDTNLPQEPADVLRLIIGQGRLGRILRLPEAPRARFYTQRSGPNRQEIAISMETFLLRWLDGADLVTLAHTYFGAVADVDYRFEQLGDLIYEYCEIFLPWVFGTLVAWTNSLLAASGRLVSVPKTVAASVRWGVMDPAALELMARGMQSRSLALRIARAYHSEERQVGVRSWLRSMSIAEWRSTFSASAADLRNILEFSRDPRGGVAVALITQGHAQLEIKTSLSELDATDARLKPVNDSELSPIEIWVEGSRVGRILSRDQADVRSVLNTGLPIGIQLSVSSGRGLLAVTLIEPAV